MRILFTSFLLAAVVSMPAASQITTGTILREPRTAPLLRMAFLSSPSPTMGRRGQQNLTIQLTGVGTHFTAGATSLNLGAGITVVSPVNVVSPTSATAVISIDQAAAPGLRAVTVTTGSEVATLADGFSVTEAPDPFAKSCAAATAMGLLTPGMSKQIYGIIDTPSVEDWFTVTIPAGATLKATLTGGDGVAEFEESAQVACWSGTIASTTPGVALKQLVLPAGSSQTFLLRIKASRWSAANSHFTLALAAQ